MQVYALKYRRMTGVMCLRCVLARSWPSNLLVERDGEQVCYCWGSWLHVAAQLGCAIFWWCLFGQGTVWSIEIELSAVLALTLTLTLLLNNPHLTLGWLTAATGCRKVWVTDIQFCRTTSLEQPPCRPTWFWTFCLGVLPVAEDSEVCLAGEI